MATEIEESYPLVEYYRHRNLPEEPR